MGIWGWGSPLGWAVFLAAVGVFLGLLGWGLFGLSKAVERFVSLQTDKKR